MDSETNGEKAGNKADTQQKEGSQIKVAGGIEAGATGKASEPQIGKPSASGLPANGGIQSWSLRKGIPVRAYLSGAALLLAGVLLLSAIEVRQTRISANIHSGLLDIELSQQNRLNPLLFKDLTWTASALLQLPDGSRQAIRRFQIEQDTRRPGGSDPISLRHIEIPEKGRLRISSESVDNRYILEIDRAVSPIRMIIPVGAAVQFEPAGNMIDLDNLQTYKNTSENFQQILITEYSNQITISGTLEKEMEYLAEVLPVIHFGFWKIKNETSPNEVRLSTVHGGLLILEEQDGKRIDFWEGEPILFSGVDGILRTLILKDSAIQFQFDGYVDGIVSGYRDESRSLMPSLLGWLINIPWVKALLALLGVLLGVSIPIIGRKKNAE